MKIHSYLVFIFFLAACSDEHEVTKERMAQPLTRQQRTASMPTDTIGVCQAMILPERLAPRSILAADVPAAQRLTGKLEEAWRWLDANGENLLVVYTTGPLADTPKDGLGNSDAGYLKSDDGEIIEVGSYQESYVRLQARQYAKRQGAYVELWRLQDQIEHCPFDLAFTILPKSTAITDLDHDGLTETTLVYTKTCRSDVSPDEMKLIMHEGAAKYALRGYNVVQFDSVPARLRQPTEPCCLGTLSKLQLEKAYQATAHGGHYFSEADFRTVPGFLRFVRQHWQQLSVNKAVETE